MTSSSIPTTSLSIKPTLGKYSTDSALTDFLPVQTNVNSMPLPANILVTCCPQKASPWPHTKFKSSKTGWNPRKSRTSNPSLVFPILSLFIHRYSKITIPLMHLTHKDTSWHFSYECHSAFKALKKSFHHSSSPYPLEPRHSNYS